MLAPTSLFVPGNGLSHHVLEWPAAKFVDWGPGPGPKSVGWGPGPNHGPNPPTVLLLHGYMDAAASWDLVAVPLATTGLRVIAPDLRGFGDAPRVTPGGYYYFPDYVHDVADVVEALVPAGSPLFVVGHSMGGTVATLYAGTFPDRPTRLAVLEGAGPSEVSADHAPDRMRGWIEGVRSIRERGDRTLASREDVVRRLASNHPRVSKEVIQSRVDALARQLPGDGWAWKADPMHGTRTPVLFVAAGWMAFARRAKCPVLFVSGGPDGWHPRDEESRVVSFPRLERAEIAGAGHMMHWTRPAELVQLLLGFFGVGAGATATEE